MCATAGTYEESIMESKNTKYENAILGGGCFWCVEAIFEEIDGIKDAVSGYAGGTVKNPDYDQVCTGSTGHAEVVRLEFDPEVISYEKILELFFISHNPTTLNRQGADIGSQYRSIILFENESQRKTAETVIARLNAAERFGGKIVTEVKQLDVFYEAEEYHQDFFRKNPDYGYCQIVILPKLKKLIK
jgi:peptide-methionine (S)-S-oxide reductase